MQIDIIGVPIDLGADQRRGPGADLRAWARVAGAVDAVAGGARGHGGQLPAVDGLPQRARLGEGLARDRAVEQLAPRKSQRSSGAGR